MIAIDKEYVDGFNWAPADQEMADGTSHGKKFTAKLKLQTTLIGAAKL